MYGGPLSNRPHIGFFAIDCKLEVFHCIDEVDGFPLGLVFPSTLLQEYHGQDNIVFQFGSNRNEEIEHG